MQNVLGGRGVKVCLPKELGDALVTTYSLGLFIYFFILKLNLMDWKITTISLVARGKLAKLFLYEKYKI